MENRMMLTYRRTPMGQARVIGGSQGLTETARRLLLLVNGLSSLGSISPRLSGEVGEAERELLAAGLIEYAQPPTVKKLQLAIDRARATTSARMESL